MVALVISITNVEFVTVNGEEFEHSHFAVNSFYTLVLFKVVKSAIKYNVETVEL